ncbi:PREDICTED: RNA polymerase II C-terminal domain phosphatase-like 4 [Camelina sativa]|uniref:protein-serine/threonine phosphatase n=1 Tax=Camelina sativa TaxID=90675 RepID=A0ABM0T105_CAMSA|nr:PREDICTED: RNA polymerase II C-terminal domain phosphatase-like 4 [Camelina sativa]
MSGHCVHWLVHNGFCCECKSAVHWYKGELKNCRRIKDPDCDHSMSYRGYCARCCCKVDESDGQLFNYISQGHHLTYKFVASMKRKRSGIGYGQRKLHLVVDLQHVLLHSRLSKDDDDGVLVKLRPFAREFLREANELFTIYAYTKSDPKQARHCVKSGVTRPNDAFLQPFSNLADGLSLSHEFVGSLKSRVSRNSLQEKKLHLVLSLSGTLFDTQTFPRLSNKEKYLKGKVNSRDDLDLWQTRIFGREVLVKLRSFVREFLREANKLFILHVHTLCIPEYADFVLKLIDPHQVYFGNRIISVSKHVMWEKALDVVLVGERQVVILDDRYDVWCQENRSNLLQITTYSYFKATKERNSLAAGGGMFKNLFKFLLKMFSRDDDLLSDSSASYSEERKDESVDDGALANALSFLSKIHHSFFNHHYNEDDIYKRDVRIFLHS